MNATHWKSITAVVVDPFGRDQLAATEAAAIARRCGARLTLLNTFMLPQPTPEAVLGSAKQNIAVAIRQRLKQLQKLAVRLARQDLVVQCAVEWDYPTHEAVVRYVLKHKPDLLVAESHRRGRIARWVLANTDWELIRSCPCPLWFVRSPRLPPKLQALVAVDPRHTNDKPARLDNRLLAAASGLAAQLKGEIDVVHAYRSAPSANPGLLRAPVRRAPPSQRTREFVAGMTRQVERLAARYEIGAEQCFVREGDTVDVLTGLTRERRTDVLVMGAVSRSVLARPVIGNTAERAIDHVGCDVLVVKPAGFKTPVSRGRPRL